MNNHRFLGVIVVGAITASLLGMVFYSYNPGNESLGEAGDSIGLGDKGEPGDIEETHSVAGEGDAKGEVNDYSGQEEREIEGRYRVLNVYDGDTFTVDYDGVETSVRIIGVNTPETVDPRKTVECFGEQASIYLKNKLYGAEVDLERDYTQNDRDKYNRLLRYAYLDGEDVGYSIIYSGYGYEYTYRVPYKKQPKYKEAEESARQNGRGLWEEGVCL